MALYSYPDTVITLSALKENEGLHPSLINKTPLRGWGNSKELFF